MAYNSEDKISIIIEGMRGETTIAELCRKESIHQENKIRVLEIW